MPNHAGSTSSHYNLTSPIVKDSVGKKGIHFFIKYFQVGKTVKNVQIDPNSTKVWSTDLNVTLSMSDVVTDGVSESVSDTLEIVLNEQVFYYMYQKIYVYHIYILLLYIIQFKVIVKKNYINIENIPGKI